MMNSNITLINGGTKKESKFEEKKDYIDTRKKKEVKNLDFKKLFDD